MPKTFRADDGKFQELVLYVAQRSEADPAFSATKLNKLLFFADFLAFASFGQPITGHRYQKLPKGPAPIAFLPVVGRMMEGGLCEWEYRPYFGKQQKRLVVHRSADLSSFSAEEIELVDQVIQQLWESNASQVSDLSHDFPGWQAVGMQEEIAYETVFVLPPRPLTKGELELARELEEA